MKRQAEKNRILLVEDEEQLLSLTEALLDERGYQVSTAQTGQSALEALECSTFDLVILDLNVELRGKLERHHIAKAKTYRSCRQPHL